MNDNATAIVILCSHLCATDDCRPLEPSEWTDLAQRLLSQKLQPKDLISFSQDDFKAKLNYTTSEIQRIHKLLERSGSIAFEIEKYADMGIGIITRADKDYPRALKIKLGKTCPPLFYYAGDLKLTNVKCVGFVGSRNVSGEDMDFATHMVKRVNHNRYAIVSGGAKGIDTTAALASIQNGNCCIEYLSDSFTRKIKNKDTICSIRNKQLLILSVAKPDAGFNTGIAMMRNKYIYAQSEGTVIVKSDYNKGGTWNGAVDAIKKQLCPVFCRETSNYLGNAALIKMGAIPIDENWDGNVSKFKIKKQQQATQITFFD